MTAEMVAGIAAACREAGCALLGGETAEMPGVYSPGEFDVAGTIVGVVESAAHAAACRSSPRAMCCSACAPPARTPTAIR